MQKPKLIMITGMSGTGKSSTSQQLAKQYELNGIPCCWIHEEIENHSIRKEGEFAIDRLDTEEGMATNIAEMLSRWKALAEEIASSNRVYVMEGCFYQSIVRYFFSSCYSEEQIKYYHSQVLEILDPLKPLIVFLYRAEVKKSLQEAFQVRGEQWKNIILDKENEGYFRYHPYIDEESIYKMYEHYQRLSNEHYEEYQGNKIKLFTADGQWQKHLQSLTEHVGLSYKPRVFPLAANPEQYAGIYFLEGDPQKRRLAFKVLDGVLYGQTSWWSNMALLYLGNHEYEVLSFPIKYIFHPDRKPKAVTVIESYGWGISGKTLIRKE